jgi:hypothetical protein
MRELLCARLTVLRCGYYNGRQFKYTLTEKSNYALTSLLMHFCAKQN